MADPSSLPTQVAMTIAEHSPALLATALLLGASATFSGCETSLFSLSAPELNRIRAGRSTIDRTISTLHAELKELLPTILFCNMAVNVLVFALAAVIANAIGERFGAGAAFAYSLASLFLVVFFGEVFPKQLAISSSILVARLTSFQVWICHRVLKKPMRALNAVVTVCERLFDDGRRDGAELREEELRLLVELSRTDGVISEDEYELIDGIVELPEVRIRDIMVPRVDVRPLEAGAGVALAMERAREGGHCKLPVLDPEKDEPLGWIDVRRIYAAHGGEDMPEGETIDGYVRPFSFFSEHDRADQVLERIKGAGAALFAVVDERGQIVGFFTLQDVMDELLGRFGEHGAPPPDQIREKDGRYIISGRFSVREWRELFDVSDAIPRSATVGGLVVSLLGRIPRPGDVVTLDNMEITVLSTLRNQVLEAGLRLKEKRDAGGGETL